MNERYDQSWPTWSETASLGPYVRTSELNNNEKKRDQQQSRYIEIRCYSSPIAVTCIAVVIWKKRTVNCIIFSFSFSFFVTTYSLLPNIPLANTQQMKQTTI